MSNFPVLNDSAAFGALEPWQYAVAFGAALFVGLSKTGIAGVGILMVPLLAMAFPARLSTGVLLPILVGGDVLALLVYRRQAQWKHVRRCLPWAIIGIAAGWAFYHWGDPADDSVKRMIGTIVLGILLLGWRIGGARARAEAASSAHAPAPESVTDASSALPASWRFAAVIGLAGGFTTMVANAAGPVWIVYLLALGLPKEAFLGTGAWVFFILNLAKVPFSWQLGLIRIDSLALNLWMLPGLLIGARLGVKVMRRLPQVWFNRAAAWLAALAAVHLLC